MIYFDNAATTYPKPEEVYQFMDSFYRNYGVNVGRGQYTLADKASSLINETRQLILKLFNCPQKKVVFTPSATESLNIILQGLNWRENYNVYVTPFEHNAVLRVLNYLKGIYHFNIVELYVDKDSIEYDIERIKYQFQDRRPDVVVLCHASNVCGLVAPIKEICELSKEYQATNIIDMAQTAGLIQTDLSEIKADYAVFAGHKTLYGPFGIAGIIMGNDSNLRPLIYGGTGIDSANADLPNTIPEKYEVGSQNSLAIGGLNAALKWINCIGIEQIYHKEIENTQKLYDLLSSFNNIRVIGIKSLKNHIGVFSCVFNGYSSDNIGQVLNNNNIAVRTGLHCAPDAHRFLETFPAGTVRFSVSYFNTDEGFMQLTEALNMIKKDS